MILAHQRKPSPKIRTTHLLQPITETKKPREKKISKGTPKSQRPQALGLPNEMTNKTHVPTASGKDATNKNVLFHDLYLVNSPQKQTVFTIPQHLHLVSFFLVTATPEFHFKPNASFSRNL